MKENVVIVNKSIFHCLQKLMIKLVLKKYFN